MPGAGAWKARNLVALADTKGERTDKTALAEAAKGKSASSPGVSRCRLWPRRCVQKHVC